MLTSRGRQFRSPRGWWTRFCRHQLIPAETAMTSPRRPLHATMEGFVTRGAVPGVVTAVSQDGDLNVDAIGVQTVGDAPMRRDTIFRISSLTKPITAAAAMLLVDDGALRLDEPVDRLLPELANRRVLRSVDGRLDDTVAATRAMVVSDVLSSRMGLGLIMAAPDSYPIQRALTELEIVTGPPKPQTSLTPDEWIRRLGTVPLMHQPGERWMYDTSSDVLGVLVGRASGMPFETFLRDRLFGPLGMSDTSFSVPPEKLSRLATCYQADPATRRLEAVDGGETSQWSHSPVFPAGRTGLVATADDYAAFAALLLDEGVSGRERILSAQSVRLMTTNQLTASQQANTGFLSEGQGWGFGMSVTSNWYGWDGGFGTSWRNYSGRNMFAILLTQRLVYPQTSGIEDAFWSHLEAISGSRRP